MTDRDKPFELEEEDKRAHKDERESEGVGQPPVAARAPGTLPPVPEVRSRSRTAEGGVDERTVAERQGRAVAPVSGARPAPPGWPREALAFPLRRPGPAQIAALAVLLALLDGVGTTPLMFLALIVKVPLGLVLLRWFLHEVGMSAAGWDRPAGIARALDLDRESVRSFRGVLIAMVLLLGPGLTSIALGRWGWGIPLLLVGSAMLSAHLLGAAVGDPSLRRPWGAAEWFVRRPLALIAGSVGFWAAVAAEWGAAQLSDSSFPAAALACLSIRAGMLYAWLVAARAIGVVGRSWTPWEEESGAA